MNNKDWNYFNDKINSEILSLNEILHLLNEGKIGYSTKVRHQNWIYWKPIWQSSEILAHIKWEYLDENDKLHKSLYGYEIVTKAFNKEIADKTLVRYEDGLFVYFKDSHLISNPEKPYSGYNTSIYNFWQLIENHVNFVICIALTLFIVLSLKASPSKELFMCITLLLDNALILLHSYFMHKKGCSLYSKLLGYNILNHDGSKLSVGKAFARHFCLKSNLEEFDKKSGIILTKQRAKEV